MTLFSGFPGVEEMGERAQKAMLTPMGAASPLWFAFGAAASAGVAYWWLTRLTKAINVEAFAGLPTLVPAPAPTPALKVAKPAKAPPAAPVVEAAPVEAATLEPASPEPEMAVAPPEPAPEPVVLPADDLTRMSGIGPKLSEALAARGVTRFAQIAAWTAQEVSDLDKALSLKGRAVREAWVAQAKRLAAGPN